MRAATARRGLSARRLRALTILNAIAPALTDKIVRRYGRRREGRESRPAINVEIAAAVAGACARPAPRPGGRRGVRDRLMGRPSKDLDLEVYGLPPTASRRCSVSSAASTPWGRASRSIRSPAWMWRCRVGSREPAAATARSKSSAIQTSRSFDAATRS